VCVCASAGVPVCVRACVPLCVRACVPLCVRVRVCLCHISFIVHNHMTWCMIFMFKTGTWHRMCVQVYAIRVMYIPVFPVPQALYTAVFLLWTSSRLLQTRIESPLLYSHTMGSSPYLLDWWTTGLNNATQSLILLIYNSLYRCITCTEL